VCLNLSNLKKHWLARWVTFGDLVLGSPVNRKRTCRKMKRVVNPIVMGILILGIYSSTNGIPDHRLIQESQVLTMVHLINILADSLSCACCRYGL
jgi:hypothetical protein